MKRTVLIVEDDDLVRDSLALVLGQMNFDVDQVSDGPEGLEKIQTRKYDFAMFDLRLPSMNGLTLMEDARKLDPDLGIIMMTSFGTVETAVEAMKLGAADYLTKPINDDELDIVVKRLLKEKELKHDNKVLKQEVEDHHVRYQHMVGSDSKIQHNFEIIKAICNTDTTVLLEGESGTGKGVTAKAIHFSDPARKDKPYVEVSCGAIPPELLESELFGHVRGSFTSAHKDRVGRFEMADGGTILLDEIDSLPLNLQVKLLRVLQQKEFERVGDTKTIRVDVRIIAATNRDLKLEIEQGKFREDLYYRLNVIALQVPPLRERKGDIPAFVEHFIKMFTTKTKRNITGIDSPAMDHLLRYNWPGNVRELENCIERAVVLSPNGQLKASVFPDFVNAQSLPKFTDKNIPLASLKESLKQPEKQIIESTLNQVAGNRKEAARLLDINRTTLYNKMKEYELL